MKPYPKYKDSGIQWIGQLPEGWKVQAMKHLFYLKGRIGWQGLKAEEFIDEGPYLVTGTDFENGKVIWERCYHISKDRFNEAPEIHVKEGDLLITKDGTIGKLAYIDVLPGETSLNSHLLIIRPLSPDIINKYSYWLLQSEMFRRYTRLTQSGSIMDSLSQEKIANFKFPLPPLSEQESIVRYLDDKAAKIDETVNLLEQQKTDLQQYRKAIIFEKVTRGMRLDTNLKDSGVQWIGKIPETWELIPCKYLFQNLDYLRKPITANQRSRNNPRYYYYGASGVIDKMDFYNVDDKVLLIGEDGANLIMRNLPLIYKAEGKIWVNNHAHILKPIKDNYDYLAYVMECADYSEFITGSAQPKLSQANLNNVKLPIPPIQEQHSIAVYLNEKTAKIDEAIKRIDEQIADLRAYRAALISDVVTGKIDVRN